MRIPARIKIGGHWVRVELVDRHEFGSSTTIGDYQSRDCLIRLSRDMAESQIAATLLHEVVEWIANEYELQMTHPQIQVMSEVLFQVLRDNRLTFYEEEINADALGEV